MPDPRQLLAGASTLIVLGALLGTDGSWSGEAGDDEIIVSGEEEVSWTNVSSGDSGIQYLYSADCPYADLEEAINYCDGTEIGDPDPTCPAGDVILPRWSRTWDADSGGWGPWQLQVGYTCAGDNDSPTFTAADFARLPIAPSAINIQPPNGWTLAGLDTIVYTAPTPQGFNTQVLGMAIQVIATPSTYTWDFGDGGSPLTTDDPGQPWPDYTVSHAYTRAGSAAPTLTTTWTGRFRVGSSGSWRVVNGTAETTTTAPELEIHTARTRLVEDPLS